MTTENSIGWVIVNNSSTAVKPQIYIPKDPLITLNKCNKNTGQELQRENVIIQPGNQLAWFNLSNSNGSYTNGPPTTCGNYTYFVFPNQAKIGLFYVNNNSSSSYFDLASYNLDPKNDYIVITIDENTNVSITKYNKNDLPYGNFISPWW